MDNNQVFEWIFSIAMAVAGWFIKNNNAKIDKLETKIEANAKEATTNINAAEKAIYIKLEAQDGRQKDHEQMFAAHRESAAARFVTREELSKMMEIFDRSKDKISTEIRDLGTRMEAKIDGLKDKLDSKQDKIKS